MGVVRTQWTPPPRPAPAPGVDERVHSQQQLMFFVFFYLKIIYTFMFSEATAMRAWHVLPHICVTLSSTNYSINSIILRERERERGGGGRERGRGRERERERERYLGLR